MIALFGLLGLALAGAALLPPDVLGTEPGLPEDDEPQAGKTVPLDTALGYGNDEGSDGEPADLPRDSAATNASRTASTPSAPPQRLSEMGTDMPDVIFGSEDEDDVRAGAGADHVDLRDGDDWAHGGAQDDEMHGGRGGDTLWGGDGDDRLWGHIGDDVIQGGAGNDRLQGGDGADALWGSAGDDALSGDLGDDRLDGGAGRDVLHGGAGDDRLVGTGDGAGDWLNGGDGVDEIHIGAGDMAHGGMAGDLFALRSAEAGEAAVIADFDVTQDQIMVLHPQGPAPELTVETVPEGLLLRADGVALARLDGLSRLDEGAVVLLTE